MAWRPRLAAAVPAGKFAARERVGGPDRVVYLVAARAGGQAGGLLQRVEAEVVVVGLVALGRAGRMPAVAARRQRGRLRVQVREHPVDEHAAGSVGVLDEQDELLGAGGDALPPQRRRLARAVAGVLRRDRAAVLEGGARDRDVVGRRRRRGVLLAA